MLELIHCSYHKCLTVLYQRVMRKVARTWIGSGQGYEHFNSRLDDFDSAKGKFRLRSVNNVVPDLSQMDKTRISRFVRDPRDLLISGYHYHKRGGEDWCNVVDPTPIDFREVAGSIPTGLQPGESYREMLNRVSLTDGLLAEYELRRSHFSSMGMWPIDEPAILTIRYEDFLGDEPAQFQRILRHYEMDLPRIFLGKAFAMHYAKPTSKDAHQRNRAAGQWKVEMPPDLAAFFTIELAEVLERYRYNG